jgi:DNA-binding LytR/AlgR family response regulator
VKLQSDDILYIEGMGDYVKFVTPQKKYITHSTLKSLEEKVNKACFMKVHRSYIINLTKIDDIRENDLFINGMEIPVSKNLKQEVLNRLNIL